MVKLQLAVYGCIPNFGRQPRKLVMIFIVLLFLFTFVTFILLAIAVKENDIGRTMVKETDSFSFISKTFHAKQSFRKKIKDKRDSRLGKLHGGPAKCRLYNPGEAVQAKVTECVTLKMEPKAFICIHPFNIDKHISFLIAKESLWEGQSIEVFKQILTSDNELGVFDIGANIGIYSITAALMGHRVVAVEPHILNLEKLHMGIQLNNIGENVIVLENAISSKRGSYELSIPSDNQGAASLTSQDVDSFCKYPEPCPPWTSTIVLNDLLEVTNFEKAIIKIDIEGHEHKAMKISKMFFGYVKVTHILMEWQNLRRYYGSKLDETEDKRLVIDMIEMLKKRGFCPVDVHKNALSLNHWYGWPDDIIWVHSNYSLGGVFVCK